MKMALFLGIKQMKEQKSTKISTSEIISHRKRIGQTQR